MRKAVQDLDFSTLQAVFADPEKARELLESIRWSDGIYCPKCGTKDRAYKLEPKEGSKRPVRPGVYKCGACRKQFTVTVGTIFESTRIPLNKWLYAIHLMCASKKGVSAHQLHRTLGITYKSAWFMCHRVRFAMTQGPLAELLTGTVEADESYVGGKPRYKGQTKRGRGSEKKTPIFTLVQRDGEARTQVVPNVKGHTLKQAIRENVDPAARIMTDELLSYRGLDREYAAHQVVTHSSGEYARGEAFTNTAESYFSLLKRGIIGAFHHVSKEHLHRYTTEFDFRWNARKISDAQRTVKALQGIEGKRLYYKEPKRERERNILL